MFGHCRVQTFRRTCSHVVRRLAHHEAISTDIRKHPIRLRQWDPWKSPYTYILAVIPFFTFGLGTWQVKRLNWKNDLVQNTEEKLSWKPIPLPSRINLDALSDYMYRRFLVRGTLQPQKSMLIGPRKYGEVMGYHLIMPLARSPERGERSTSSSSTVLINLGFVSNEAAESYRSLASSPPSSESSRPVKSELREFNGKEIIIEALIPAPQTVNWFTPENKPEQGDWVWADAQAMAQYAGGTEANVVPLLMDEIFEGNIGEANQRIAKGVPVGRAPVVTFRNQHTSYAVTWYSLSAFTSFLLYKLITRGRASHITPFRSK